jgi:putative aldouronate transport system substrate-binding protein
MLALCAIAPSASLGAQATAITRLPEPVTFSMLLNDKEGTSYRPDWLVMKEIERRKNVRFSVRAAPDGSYGKTLAEVLGSASIPDIVLKVWPEQLASAAAAGLLLPISDYEHLMPNYNRYIRDNGLEEEIDKLRDENGKYYVLPGFQREIQVQQWIYRKDLFDRYGIPAPASYEELFRALVLLKEKFPASRPLSACWGGAHLFAMMGSGYGIPAGWNGDRLYDWKTDSWIYAPATKNWQEMFRFLARCYKAGLLDPEVFTQDPERYTRKLLDGSSFVTVTWISSGFDNWNKQLAGNGFPGAVWVPLMVPKSTIGIQALPGVARFRKGATIPVRVIREPYFRRLLDFLDWIYYSEEGRNLAVWGVEGTTYSVPGGKKEYLPTIRSFLHPEGKGETGRDFGLNTVFDLCEVPDFEDAKKPPEIVDFLNKVLARKLTEKSAPSLNLPSEDLETIRIFSAELTNYVNGMIQAFVTGKSDLDRDWKEYQSALEKNGSRKLEKIWNDAWKGRPNANKKP